VNTLSVVTITFNDHDGLKLTAQSLPTSGFEWIVIDGSSNPHILELNKNYLRNFKVILIQETDSGRFDAMNKGLKIANGEIVCFLNGGDRFSSKEVPSKVVENYHHKGWSWAVGKTKAVANDGAELWNWPMPTHRSLKLLLGVNSYCHQATFVQTSILRSIGGFDVNSLYSDWVISLLLSRMCRPFALNFQTTLFLSDGISSQQTINYWQSESKKLRGKYKVCIFNNRFLDSLMQMLAATFISTSRGRLIRPDLVKKYK